MAHSTASSLTLTNALLLMASLAQDEGVGGVGLFWSSAQKTTALQDWYVRWYERFSDRMAQYAGSATFGSISGSTKKSRTTDHTVLSWRHAYLEVNGTNFAVGAELEIMRPERVRALQLSEATVGTPARIGFEKVAGITAGASGDTAGHWDAYLHPIPSGAVFVSAHVRTTPYVPGVGADTFDCSPAQARIVCALAALECASLAGKDTEFLENRWRVIPEEVQAVFRLEMAQKILSGQVAAGGPVT